MRTCFPIIHQQVIDYRPPTKERSSPAVTEVTSYMNYFNEETSEATCIKVATTKHSQNSRLNFLDELKLRRLTRVIVQYSA